MVAAVDDVFRALADPSRRHILDRLRRRDGQTLGELCAAFEMSRFGVMKHLKVLEEAHLVVSRRVGREKHHFLNRVPIRRIHDRWVSRYTAPLAAALSDLKTALEAPMPHAESTQLYELFIRTTPERLWQALTNPEHTRRYFFGTAVQSTFEAGAPFNYDLPGGQRAVDGTILESDPPRKLVMTWTFRYDPALAVETSTVTWLIEPRGGTCKLTVIHECAAAPLSNKHAREDGWSVILSGLKTLLETGEPLMVAPPAAT